MINSFRGDYFFLSNFYSHRVRFEDIFYPSSEHAFQAAKTLDQDERRTFAKGVTAADAKHMGRAVKLRPDWEKVKLVVMETILREKFQDPVLKSMLLATGSEELVEGNTWGDRYWGKVGDDGHNHLGKIHMKIRAELQPK